MTMARYRQHDVSQMYLQGCDAAMDQLNNDGMGFAETAKDVSPSERADFFKGYHDTVGQDPKWGSKLAA